MKILIFGATGSAGGSVLRECLASPAVSEVRAIARRSPDVQHPKLTTVIHSDYEHYERVAHAFESVDLCLYCLGKSVSQVDGEAAYRRLTHGFAIAAAAALRAASPAAPFYFVSGRSASLDSRYMWARVKAETERDLLATTTALCWRPASIDGVPSASEPKLYRVIRPIARLFKSSRGFYISGSDLGRAMLQAHSERMIGRIIENEEIRDLADRWRGIATAPRHEST